MADPVVATYVSGTSLTVDGDHTTQAPADAVIFLYQGVDGNTSSYIESCSYSAVTGLTTINLLTSVATVNLATIKVPGPFPEQIPLNALNAAIPASELSQEEVDGVHNSQGIDPAAAPTFAGLTLTDLTGLLTGNGASPLAALAEPADKTKILGWLGGALAWITTPNDTRSDGAGLSLRKAKDGLILPIKSLDADDFEEGSTDLIRVKDSSLGAPAPDYKPPAFLYKDVDEIYVPKGIYYQMSYRHGGQYQEPSASFWNVAAKTAVDIDGTYAAGTTSGMIGGAKVNSSWYSVFMMTLATGVPILLVLPFVRVKAIAYSAPDSVITPGDHDTGGSFADGFLLADDVWNNFRLVKFKIEDVLTDGNVYTIADSVTGTHDEIHITGNKTSEISALDWFQLIPPAGTACLYLGTIRINSSGNVRLFSMPDPFNYVAPYVQVNMSKTILANQANTDLSTAVPPTAKRIKGYALIDESMASQSVIIRTFMGISGTDATNQIGAHRVGVNTGATTAGRTFREQFVYDLSATGIIRNNAAYFNGSAVETAGAGTYDFAISGWDE